MSLQQYRIQNVLVDIHAFHMAFKWVGQWEKPTLIHLSNVFSFSSIGHVALDRSNMLEDQWRYLQLQVHHAHLKSPL